MDRADAGRRLAAKLAHLKGEPVVVLGLPRGGVPVALEIAMALGAPLDVVVVRKLGVPAQPELGMGAIGEGGVRVVNEEVVAAAGISAEALAVVEEREQRELERRARRYRGDRPRRSLAGRTAVVVDDGIATGSTAQAACRIARAQGAARVVLAVPVAPAGWEERMGESAGELVCLDSPDFFFAIGEFYEDFSQTSDDEVVRCLALGATAGEGRGGSVGAGEAGEELGGPVGDMSVRDDTVLDEEVLVGAGSLRLGGRLTIPPTAREVVIFAHGSGSSRHSPRNQYVAGVLSEAGIGTLLFDLLTPKEETDRANVFDITLLARRLVDVTNWLRSRPGTSGLGIAYFGASTGAAAALSAAAEPGADIFAAVSRGGRPDLAGTRLFEVKAPTLLIVGGRDNVVLDLNRQAQENLRCENDLVVIDGATHLFEEPGTLQLAAEAARDWFASHAAG